MSRELPTGNAGSTRLPFVAALRRIAHGASPVVLALLVGIATFFLFRPGVLNPDSADQLAEARSGELSDWHSAWLTLLWRWMMGGHDAVWTMLALQIALFWSGAAVLAAGLVRLGRPRQAWAVLGVSLFPHFFFFNHYILKDTAFYSAMFLCAGVCLGVVFSGPATAWWRSVLAVFVLAATLPIRINGAFAIAGLVVPLLWPRAKLSLPRLVVGVACASLALILAARWFNASVLQARNSDVIQSLQIHDLMGIQYHSRDARVWGPYALSNDEVDRCYSSFHWDTMSPTGVCSGLRPRIGAPDGRFFLPEAAAKRAELWLAAIRTHPLAYLEHRFRYFNSATFFIVPSFHARFSKAVRDGSKEGRAPVTASDIRFDYVKKNFIVWPVTALAVGLGMLLLLWPGVRESTSARCGVALLASGISYGLAYLAIGVATDVRYFLWTQLATGLAAVVAWRDLRNAWLAFPQRRAWAWGGVIGIIAIGLVSRLADVPFV